MSTGSVKTKLLQKIHGEHIAREEAREAAKQVDYQPVTPKAINKYFFARQGLEDRPAANPNTNKLTSSVEEKLTGAEIEALQIEA
ncbi:hypothetical protein DAPPUDRAFT_259401 [Daphnia pulex]|uniref:Uncharacterized protein n=1 Tax=Daphnia pulex TaxID=6669 RepID=E9HH67_DAPPU|nr:hypothetical protein DAPPUDRAFT_259401 [Daphnia pulex]|eukprot:EFX68886.1 hypothetical protein DAPPUDRAFT_259401 [Daphnia pulex]